MCLTLECRPEGRRHKTALSPRCLFDFLNRAVAKSFGSNLYFQGWKTLDVFRRARSSSLADSAKGSSQN
jgi:hypothetical protein